MSERGRRLELNKEWGDATTCESFESWLINRVISLETALAVAKATIAELRAKGSGNG